MPTFILLDNLRIKKQKTLDKTNRLKNKYGKKISEEKEKCNKLEKDIHNKKIENKILKSKKCRINKALEEVKLKNDLEELKSNNEIEEIKMENKKEIELLDEEAKNQIKFLNKENYFYSLNEKMKKEKGLLEHKKAILSENLNENIYFNYEKALEKEKRKKEKEFKEKEKEIFSERIRVNLKEKMSRQYIDQLREKNKLEIQIAQVEMANDKLRRKNDNLNHIGNKYNTITERVKNKIEEKKKISNKLDENTQKNIYSNKNNFTTYRKPLKNKNYY